MLDCSTIAKDPATCVQGDRAEIGQKEWAIPSLETRWIIQVLHLQNSYHKNTVLNLQRLWLTHYDHPAALHWNIKGGRATLFSLCWNIYKDKSVIVETCVNTGTDINTYSSVSTMFCATTGKLKENQEFFFPASGSKIKRQHRICQICNVFFTSTMDHHLCPLDMKLLSLSF